jgi:uncharacterized membrane protein
MRPSIRLAVCTFGGLLSGLICYSLAASSAASLPTPVIWQIIASRTLIGVAIGLSRFTFGHWAIHGAVLGALFSLPLAFSGLMAPENPQFSASAMFFSTVVMGVIYGFLIELVVFALDRMRRAMTKPATAAG